MLYCQKEAQPFKIRCWSSIRSIFHGNYRIEDLFLSDFWEYPVGKFWDSGTDTRKVWFCTSNAPANDSTQKPATIFAFYH